MNRNENDNNWTDLHVTKPKAMRKIMYAVQRQE